MRTLLAAAIGLVAGIASGSFGIGGALLSTPGIRVLLDTPALIAVGTTLPVIVPTALTGLIAYVKAGFVDLRLAATAAASGSVFAVLGAYSTTFIRGEALMIATAGLILLLAGRMLWPEKMAAGPMVRGGIPLYLLVGAGSGYLSGLLGVGGGLVLVPVFTVLFRLPLKTALGTSLAVVSAQAIPGSVVHALIGNVDWRIAAGLLLGVLPGARIGSRLAVAARDTTLRLIVGIGLAALALAFGISELRLLLR